MDNSGKKNAPNPFRFNPNAPSFVPAAKKIPAEWLDVEEFSPRWYALMKASPEYQQYWEKTHFQDEEDLFADDMQALHDLDALVESEQAKQQVVGNKEATRKSIWAGNKVRFEHEHAITGSVDALGVMSLSKDAPKEYLLESTNGSAMHVNATADTRVFRSSPELVGNSPDNSQQLLEGSQDACNGKEVDPVHSYTDIGCGRQSQELIINSKDTPQQQLAESDDAQNENEIHPVHSDTDTGGNVHALELTSNSENTPQQHLTESTNQGDSR